MKICKLSFLAFSMSLLPIVAFAGGSSSCHFHGSAPAEEKVVAECAKGRIEKLISSKKISETWNGKAHEKIELIEGKKGKEWKVTFSNSQEKDASKANLFLFFSHSGNFIAANHSGN